MLTFLSWTATIGSILGNIGVIKKETLGYAGMDF